MTACPDWGESLNEDIVRESVAATCLLMNYTLQSRREFKLLPGGIPQQTKKSKLALSWPPLHAK